MGFEARCLFDLIDVEGMFEHAFEIGAKQFAARRQDQSVVTQAALGTEYVHVADPFALDVDTARRALYELHAHCIEQSVQPSHHGVDVRLIETRPDAQFRLGRQDSNLHVISIMLVQQAGRAQCAPYSAEASTNNQNLLFHDLLPKTKSIR